MNARTTAVLVLAACFCLASCEVDGDRHAPPMNIVTSDETLVHERVQAPGDATTTREFLVYQQR